MGYYICKVVVSAVLIVLVSEVSKRSTALGGVFASLPLLSVLAMIWLYVDTRETVAVSKLASSTFWMAIPSLVLFIALPLLLKKGLAFYASLGISCFLTFVSYLAMIAVLRKCGIVL